MALALSVAVCDVVTEVTIALKDAVEAPDGTETVEGTVTALLLLARFTPTPTEGAGTLRATVHGVVPAPVNELVPHESELTPGATVDVVGGTSDMETACTLLAWVAVIFAVWFALTADAFAVNVVLVAPAGTVTEAGTVTAATLLERPTTSPLAGAAALVVTVQVSVPAPVIWAVAQLNPLSAAV